MPEDKAQKDSGATVRVPQWVLDEVEAIWQKLPRPRPTRGDVLAKAWTASKEGRPTEDDPDIERLRYVKEHGQKEHVSWLQGNIKAFHELAVVSPRTAGESAQPRKKKAG